MVSFSSATRPASELPALGLPYPFPGTGGSLDGLWHVAHGSCDAVHINAAFERQRSLLRQEEELFQRDEDAALVAHRVRMASGEAVGTSAR